MTPGRTVPADPGARGLLREIAGHLEADGLLGYPTETVYGLGAAADDRGIRALQALKNRRGGDPFLVLIPGIDEPGRMGLEWSRSATRLAEAFWPGPLTLVLRDPGLRHPEGIRGPSGGVAVRVSPQPFVEALMEAWARPLLSTSANVAGASPAETADQLAAAMEGRPGAERLWIADAGRLGASMASAVVDCTGSRPRLLRPGPIGIDALRAVAPELVDEGSQRG